MNDVLIKKIKNAINSSHPIELINEIIVEYDEIRKLAEWRMETLKNGKDLKKHQKEIERIASMLEESGYHYSTSKSDIDKEVRDFFKKL